MNAGGPYDLLRYRAAERIGELELDPIEDQQTIRSEIDRMVSAYQRSAFGAAGTRPFRDPAEVSSRLVDSLVGYGPLTLVIDRHDVEEIFIEGERVTFIDSSGQLQALDVPTTEEENRQIVSRILAGTNRRLDVSNPIEQARVLGGRARLTAVIPPVADRLSVTLRKYTAKNYDLGFLVESESLSPAAAAFLWTAARAGTTVLFSGAPGTGKTTMLSAYLRAVPADSCIRVCEEVRELDFSLLHGSFYEASPANMEGHRRFSLRDLVKVVLAQRPDFICVGEVRGSEAFELTRAVNAGCGFACTIHADSAASALIALVNAALMAGENVNESVLTRVFGTSIDFVVHLRRDQRAGGGGIRRRVMEILTLDHSRSSEGLATVPLFERDRLSQPLEWSGQLPPKSIRQRLDWSLPDGTSTESVLSGRWRPQL